MKYNHHLILSALLAAVFISLSCRHQVETLPGTGNGGDSTMTGNPADACDPNKIYFQQQVLPILISNCAMSSCHDDASHQEGVVLTSYQKVMSTAGIRPGRPGNSELYERITDTDPRDRMPRPPQAPLTPAQVQLIRQWIEQGAQNLICQNMCDSTSFTYSGAIRAVISNKCQGCHSGTAASGGIDLSTYAGIKAKVTDGRLWGAVNHQAGFSAMPKNGAKLSDCEIAQIRKWIGSGSPNN
jgi:uncharacterized membrane protein